MRKCLIGGSEPKKLLEAVDEPFDQIARAVDGAVKGASAVFIDLMRDGLTNTALAQISAYLTRAIAFISDQPMRPLLRTTTPWTVDDGLLHQAFKGDGFMALSSR